MERVIAHLRREEEVGGYEAESAWEYGPPAALARGTEEIVTRAVHDLQARGVG